MKFKLAFIGFGVVGQGLAEILYSKEEELREKYDFEFEVLAISDVKLGSIYNKDGVDLGKILELVDEGGKISDYPEGKTGLDSIETIKDTEADTIIEVTFTDMETGGPALEHVKTALNEGKHVVSTNKGPVAQEVNQLLDLAERNDAHYKFEGTVLSGTPAINLAMKNLAGCEINEIKGIVNGTTNYILSKMEESMGYQEALDKAQELGYAEADPTGDVEGIDAQGKTLILSNTVMNADMDLEEVERKGITDITKKDIEEAKEENKRWKLIAQSKRTDNGIEAKVSPEKIPLDHPLAGVMGPTNAITFSTDHLGEVTIIGPGAGKEETGYALMVDLLSINDELKG
ncbi:MAG: homoserine dehydrogenase [Candidatus Thermoplasmatota archaeon]|nr:homoserine dehydrogenase [Candidatus Thermoplasmatota archaeon]